MRRLLLAALLVALPAAAARVPALTPAQIEPGPVYVTRVDGRLLIGTDGRVVRYDVATALPGKLADDVARMVRQLRFEPVEVDGRTVNAETDMRVALVATRIDDGALRLTLDNLTFPQAEAEAMANSKGAILKRSPVNYPVDAAMARAEADVLVALHFDAAGNVVDAAAQQSALVNAGGRAKDVAAILGVFEQTTVAAAKRWKVDVARLPDDARVGDGYVSYVAFKYRLEGPRSSPVEPKPGEWTLQTRSLKRVPAWAPAPDGAPQPGVADLADGEAGFANRRFRLATPLAATGS